jgi:hypothetical protein
MVLSIKEILPRDRAFTKILLFSAVPSTSLSVTGYVINTMRGLLAKGLINIGISVAELEPQVAESFC